MTAPITGLSSMATRTVLADLAEVYQRRTGGRVAIRSMGGVDAARLIRSGAATGLVVLASGVMASLEAEGHLVPGSRTAFVRSGIAVAVPAGATHPDIRDEAALRRAMRDAASLAYSTGPSGDHLRRLWERWGLADEMSRRAIQAPPGVSVASLLARGVACLGVQQLSEMIGVEGVEIVGPLPAEAQSITVFEFGLSALSADRASCDAFIGFATGPDAEAIIVRNGLSV
ncbi:substrate-binding domain-containing protein (plasmid) [Methylobacterium currus]|uniref:substrate-binding domain-containing protein n=1 Tax=Methylobacterium currus TaxID=2051553 RepID=UPI001E3A218E|nr:substrate-binding domain-containing protein [Methylobacterium currus]UHC20179.1 substrate-binding domain-containing protein [Methylobacterium currus]